MTNRELIRKSDWAVADLSSGGLLNPEQSNRFVRKLLVQPTLLRSVRSVLMNSHTMKINKIQFDKRILRPGVEYTPLAEDPGDTGVGRSRPVTEQVELVSKEQIAEVRLSYDLIEDNIENGDIGLQTSEVSGRPAQGGLKDTIMQLMAERVALDLEELAILGDTGSGDAYLAQLDGYLQQATANVVNNANAGVSKSLFKAGVQTMPDQYLRNRTAMRHYLSVDQETSYRDNLGNRETTLGDAQINGTAPVFGMGTPVEPVSLIPNDQGMFTNPMNLIWGIHRQIHMESDKDITARAIIIVVTTRVDFLIEEVEAIVKYTNIGTP